MPSPYFIAVDPSPTKQRMFFGRRREIETISSCLQGGESILLLGERRIGKTFLLFMLHDLTKRGAEFYTQLLDRETGAFLGQLQQVMGSYLWPLVDMLQVNSPVGFYFNVLSELAGDLSGETSALSTTDHLSFVREIMALSERLSQKGQRAVVLIDEAEKLLHLEESSGICSCLKAAIQQCDAINFLFAGDLKPHESTPAFENLKGVLRPIYLPPLAPMEVKGLVQIPVQGELSFEEATLQRIIELTGGKPSLVQILCGHLYDSARSENQGEVHITLADFDRLWEAELRARVFESFDGPLRDFFEGLQGNDHTIFSFLAYRPLATAETIADVLGIEIAAVRRSVNNLRSAHRIEELSSGYRICGRIVEEFGALFVPSPQIKTRAIQRRPLAELLRDESATVEYKSSLRWDMREQRMNRALEKAVAKTVAGFLNAEGGILLIGIADDRTIVGIEHDLQTLTRKDRDSYERTLRQVLADALGVEFSIYQHVDFEDAEGKTVCLVCVDPSPRPVYLTDGDKKEFYARLGNATKPLDIEAAHKYIAMHWPQ